MKNILMILSFFITIPAIACIPLFSVYYSNNGKIYFGVEHHGIDESVEVLGVDTLTFSMNEKCSLYATDKDHVYYEGQILKGANSKTFVFLGGVKTISGEEGYSKDDKKVFYRDGEIDSVDINSFKIIPSYYDLGNMYEDGYATDKNKVFRHGLALKYDPMTFRILGWGYTLDKSGVYFNGKQIEGVDPKDYCQKSMYLVGNNKVYISGKEFKDYEAASFEVLEVNTIPQNSCGGISIQYVLTKDENGVYVDNRKLDWADVATFKVGERSTVSDKSGIYKVEVNRESRERITFNKQP